MPVPVQFHVLSFEGPDAYARAGGIATRVSGLTQALSEANFETHLWFIGDPDLPGHETRGRLHLHRWCQWISCYHPAGVYDGEEGKRLDYARSLPPFLLREALWSHLQQGGRAIILAEEWHTVDAVLHLDRLLRLAGVREQVTLFWNANNTFGFDRLDWGRLASAATMTTVSRHMKQLMRPLGISPLVIPNGLAAEMLLPPERQAVAAFRTRLCGRTVVAKVARWDPDKRWLLAVATLAAMKSQGWRPLLIARGGIEAHGHEVLAAAAAVGLRVVERPLPQPGVRGLLQALEGLEGADLISLRSPLDGASCQVLFQGADAVLANSGHEPFGLVGLETMAAGGVACTGGSGEDYGVPRYNALVLETEDPQEFLGLFAALRAHPAQERALRRAGRLTARQYGWPQVLQRALLPRLALHDHPTLLDTAVAHGCKEPGRMRIHVEGVQTPVPSPLLGWIAERLEALNTLPADISHAHVALVQHTAPLERRHEARVRLIVAGCLLQTRSWAPTPNEAASVALTRIEQALRQRRAKPLTVGTHKGRMVEVSAVIPSLRSYASGIHEDWTGCGQR